MLSLYAVFSIGVLVQAIYILQSVMEPKSVVIAMAKSVGVSLLAFLPGKSEQQYNFYTHYGMAIFFFLCAFSVMNNKKILPIISERFLILINMVFIYYIFGGLMLLLSLMSPLNAIFVGIIIFLPTIAVLVNGLVPARVPEWAKACFYLWYLCMTSVLLFLVMLPSIFVIIGLDQMSVQFWFMLFSLGMLSVSLSVDVVNALLIVPIPGRHQTFAERWANVKLHFQLLSSKYEDESLQPLNTFILIVSVVVIFGLNAYFLHLSDFLVTSMVFLAGRMILSGYQSQANAF